MAELVASDMTNNASSGQYAGSSRPDIFQKKIDDKRPFIIGKDKVVLMTPNGRSLFNVTTARMSSTSQRKRSRQHPMLT